MKLLVRGFACCVLATAAHAQSNVTVVYPPPAQPSSVVVFLPERPVIRPVMVREEFEPTRQITYFIAFKDNVVRVADQYWVDGKTIFVLTTDHQRLTAPVNTVDRILSARLNNEQNVAFILPPERGTMVARTRVVRHTASVVHKTCHCVSTRVPASGVASRSAPAAPASK
jgi:hypothetical protein